MSRRVRQKPTIVPISLFLILFGCGAIVSCRRAPKPEADLKVDWNRYYSNETNEIMRNYAGQIPKLTKLYSIGKSFKGADLMVMEVTNREAGPAEEKPGFYVDGNIHSGELTGSAVTLYLMGYLLDRYGKDPVVTAFLDTRVFYLRPQIQSRRS